MLDSRMKEYHTKRKELTNFLSNFIVEQDKNGKFSLKKCEKCGNIKKNIEINYDIVDYIRKSNIEAQKLFDDYNKKNYDSKQFENDLDNFASKYRYQHQNIFQNLLTSNLINNRNGNSLNKSSVPKKNSAMVNNLNQYKKSKTTKDNKKISPFGKIMQDRKNIKMNQKISPFGKIMQDRKNKKMNQKRISQFEKKIGDEKQKDHMYKIDREKNSENNNSAQLDKPINFEDNEPKTLNKKIKKTETIKNESKKFLFKKS